MIHIEEGQCGLCVHFGEHGSGMEPEFMQRELIQIRNTHEAPENLVTECGHPNNEKLHLRVTPISGCAGFEQANIESNSSH